MEVTNDVMIKMVAAFGVGIVTGLIISVCLVWIACDSNK